MKQIIKTCFIAIILLAYSSSFSQAPGKFNYQAVIRSGDTALPNASLTLRFQLWDQLVAGNQLYQEDFPTTTNGFGVVNLQIGTNPTLGNLSLLNWGAGSFFVDILISQNGGSFSEISSSRTQLLSVPYALYANNADTAAYAINAPTITYSAGSGISIIHDTIYNTSPHGKQMFTTVGAATFIVPANVTQVWISGAGGGGGGGQGGNGNWGGGGGGGGAAIMDTAINVTSGTSLIITVGGGGAAGSSGGNTTINIGGVPVISLAGGGGGGQIVAGAAGGRGGTTGQGGTEQTATGADEGFGGSGGGTMFGSGGGGGGAENNAPYYPGGSGGLYGGGGGGGGGGQAGGAGAQGFILVEW